MDYSKNLDLKDIVYFCEINKIEKTEQWKDIPGYEGIYQVSDLGRVKSFKCNKEKILKNNLDDYGYYRVVLNKKIKKIINL